MKVKETAIRLSRHCFLKRTAGRRESRSCSVVRSIMTDSRSVDPGSNPGTSTNSLNQIDVLVGETFCCSTEVVVGELLLA